MNICGNLHFKSLYILCLDNIHEQIEGDNTHPH